MMHRDIRIIALLLCLAVLLQSYVCTAHTASTAEASSNAKVRGTVQLSKSDILKGIRVVVDGGAFSTYVRQDGTFTLFDLAPGVHIVEIFSEDYTFPQYRIEVSAKGKRRAFINDESKTPVSIPLDIQPLQLTDYFMKKEEFDVWSLLKNPMIIILLVGAGLAFIMPKIADAETLKEAQQTMQEGEEALRSTLASIKKK